MKRKYVWVVVVAATFQAGLTQSYFDPLGMSAPEGRSARQVGLGFNSSSVTGTPAALVSNPALIANPAERFVGEVSIAGLSIKERRTFPVLDSFGDYLADNTYVSNANWFPSTACGMSVHPLKAFALAFHYENIGNERFNYEEEVREALTGEYNRDPLAGYHRLQHSGGIRSLSAGGAFDYQDHFSLGFAITALLKSEITEKYEVEVLRPSNKLASDSSISYHNLAHNQGAYRLTCGVRLSPLKHFSFALAYSLPYELNFKDRLLIFIQDSTELLPQLAVNNTGKIKSTTYQYPGTLRLGLTYRPTNLIPTVFYLEGVNERWSACDVTEKWAEAGYTVQDSLLFSRTLELRNVWKISAGIEHQLFSGLVLRFGYYQDVSPVSADLNRNWFTLGLGTGGEKMQIDLAIAFTNGEYRYADLFPVAGEERITRDTVREHFLYGKVGIRYTF